ncbi:MAG: glycosyltransferase [Rhodocyclaceae bacterium]
MAPVDQEQLDRIALLIVHYNTPEQTERCIHSALRAGFRKIHLLDNASSTQSLALLEEGLSDHEPRIELHRSSRNLGFAGGCNRLVRILLERSEPHTGRATGQGSAYDWVFLLNSDTELNLGAIPALLDALREHPGHLIAARMHRPEHQEGDAIESLGLCCYRSLIAGNRKELDDPCIGPTGGCALLPFRLLHDLNREHGHLFDDDFFCYAEDFDLAVRARLLGYDVHYLDSMLAWHEGQASVSQRDFITYHGLRNSVWVHLKCFPLGVLISCLPWLLAAHAGSVLRLVLQRRFALLYRIYRDTLLRAPEMLRKRRRILRNVPRARIEILKACISPRFYERGYLRRSLKR